MYSNNKNKKSDVVEHFIDTDGFSGGMFVMGFICLILWALNKYYRFLDTSYQHELCTSVCDLTWK